MSRYTPVVTDHPTNKDRPMRCRAWSDAHLDCSRRCDLFECHPGPHLRWGHYDKLGRYEALATWVGGEPIDDD